MDNISWEDEDWEVAQCRIDNGDECTACEG